MAKNFNTVQTTPPPWVLNSRAIFDEVEVVQEEESFRYLVNPLQLILCLRKEYDGDESMIVGALESFEKGRAKSDTLVKKVMKSLLYKDDAANIIDYFRFKYAQRKLSGINLTGFAETVCHIANKIKREEFNFTRSEIKVLYRLPDFYQEDCFYDKLTETYKSCNEHYGPNEPVTLKYVGTQSIVRRRRNEELFCFANEDNTVSTIAVSKDNNLLGVLKYIVNTGKRIIIKGNSSISNRCSSTTPFNVRFYSTFEIVDII